MAQLLKHYVSFLKRCRITFMSDLFPKVTSDEIEPEAAAEQAKREEELKSDKPPHHDS